jgi:hypothetical protein
MIRVAYSNGSVDEYRTVELAKFMVVTTLFASRGDVVPIHAVEVLGITTGGVSVERDLRIRLGLVQFEHYDF